MAGAGSRDALGGIVQSSAQSSIRYASSHVKMKELSGQFRFLGGWPGASSFFAFFLRRGLGTLISFGISSDKLPQPQRRPDSGLASSRAEPFFRRSEGSRVHRLWRPANFTVTEYRASFRRFERRVKDARLI
jgi:hypothetical protein